MGLLASLLKNMKVSWDDYSQYMDGKIKNVPNHQSALIPKD